MAFVEFVVAEDVVSKRGQHAACFVVLVVTSILFLVSMAIAMIQIGSILALGT